MTERDAGSDPSAIAATRRADRRRLSAQRREVVRHLGRRRQRLRRDGERGRRRASGCPTLFVVDRERAGGRDRRRPAPSRTATPTATRRSASRDVEVAEDDVIGGVGGGDELQRSWFTEERLGIAARCGGAMWRLLDETVGWALEREQGGSADLRPPGSLASRSPTRPPTPPPGRLLTLTVAALADAGADPKIVHHKASMAKLFTSEAAWRCADRCVQAFGGRGYLRSNVAERLLRELRVDRIWEGTSEIQRLIVARGLERRGVERDPSLSAERRRPQPARIPLRCSSPARSPSSAPTTAPGSYGDIVLRNLAARRLRGRRLGRQPAPRARSTAVPACRRVADLPEPVDAVVVAIPAAGVPGVIAEAVGARLRRRDRALGRASARSRRAASWSGSCARPRRAGGLPVCGPNGNGIVAVAARARRCGATRSLRCEPGGVAMISQSGNVAVNALGSRRGIRLPHGPLHRQPGGARRRATGSRPSASDDGVRSVAMFLESDGDGARLAEALARCAERGVRVAVLKVGRLGGRRRAPRRRTPERVAGDQRVFRALIEEAGARLGARPPRAAGARASAGRAARPAARRRRPRDPDLLGRRLEHRRRRGGAARRRAARARRRDARAARRAAAGGGDGRQPARLHGDDLGRHRSAAPDHRRRRGRPGDRPAAGPLRPSAGPRARGGGRAGPRSARGSSPAPTRPRPRRSSPRPSPT